MKKTYMTPSTKNVKVGVSRMVCVSGTLDKTQTIDNASGFGSRQGGDFWDDEE